MALTFLFAIEQVKGVQTYVAKENWEMARILQNKDIALLFGVFRS